MGKIVKSRMKRAAFCGIVLSALSLFAHFFLAVYTGRSVQDHYSQITIFSWRQRFRNAALPTSSPAYRRLWGPVPNLESLLPHATPRGNYEAPNAQNNGYIFVKIQGSFHEIRNSICDVVAVSRLLNSTLVIPELLATSGKKGISSAFKRFAYLFNEDHFISALAKDVFVVKALPKNLKAAKRRKEIPNFKAPYSASLDYYLKTVLPALRQYSIVELRVSDGGCLQAILPPQLEEYQRLRCRVAFHALLLRQDVHDLAMNILHRLRASGRPFIAYDVGLTKDALAYHGCSEVFQDVHQDLIQHRRLWMIKQKLINGELSIDSMKQRLSGLCPFMPEEVGILFRAFGYSSDTIIYVSGGEIFGGQRILLPLHAMFENVVDRISISSVEELTSIYGHEDHLTTSSFLQPPAEEEMLSVAWTTSGPRPRPLPPPPSRFKYLSNTNDWWNWIADADKEHDNTGMQLRTNSHKLLWEAIDYTISVEADVFFPGFDRDGKGHPNFASLVMGHRLYLYAASKTFRPNRQALVRLLEDIRDHLYLGNQTWLASIRKNLKISFYEGLDEASTGLKGKSFLSHPVPECSCVRRHSSEASHHAPASSKHLKSWISLGVEFQCPAWMESAVSSIPENDVETDEADNSLPEEFLQWDNGQETSETELNSGEDTQMEDQEDLEGGAG